MSEKYGNTHKYIIGEGIVPCQPEELDEQYGSSSTSSWEKEWKVKGA
jgi:hypothetical protein